MMKPDDNVVPLLPTHSAPDATVKRRRGRPQKLEAKPGLADLAYFHQLNEAKRKHVSADDVVTAVENKADALEVIRRIKLAVAREASSLEFQRLEGEKRGRDGAQISSRRIDALVRLSNLEIEGLRLQAAVVDPRSEPVQRMAALWIQDLVAVAKEVLPHQQLDVFMTRLETKMEDWETRVESMLR